MRYEANRLRTDTICKYAVLTQPLRHCAFKFVGTNDVGPQWTFIFPNVQLSPSAALVLAFMVEPEAANSMPATQLGAN